jgi:hypothetical protein
MDGWIMQAYCLAVSTEKQSIQGKEVAAAAWSSMSVHMSKTAAQISNRLRLHVSRSMMRVPMEVLKA